ncbi:unnamed protein product [Rotaria sp. Silwood2]|nr:unnamed protein product [Rotaria sp. Silwood2]CAF3056052.1 unnamed protein product [Rotaria sp. Silwood2]CAF3305214.1 unnamed protein product [Rotaria sp. Silwood2]CAF3426183.1 unnamed protein product [Rotaria sp. Silwood2]CAF4252763.1 unnamed protein product [Rotaria sp. Silwood2]
MRIISGFFIHTPNMTLHQLPEAFRIVLPGSWDWFFLRSQQLLLFFQDATHLATKWRNRILSSKAELTIGNFQIKMQHLLDLLTSPDKKIEHNLVQTDVNPKDKQNFPSCKKISSQNVLDLLLKKKETEATYVYLNLLQYIISAYVETSTPIEDRLYYSWTVVFVCRMWKIWLNHNSPINTSTLNDKSSKRNKNKNKYFITTPIYRSIEINSHNLLYLIILVKQRTLPKEALNVFLFSSQPCESTFKNARALSGIYHTAVNFTAADFLRRSEKLSILNEEKCNNVLNENDRELKFPIHHKGNRVNYDSLSNLNDIDKISVENIILAAFNRAKELVSNLNILPSLKKCNACELNGLSKNIFDSIRFNINSDTYSATDADSSSDSESDYDDETMESNEFNSDLINVDEEDKDAATTQSVDEIKTEKINFTGMRIFDSINPAMKNSYFQVQINNKIKFIHKQTACWLLTDKASRLSADRLSRVIETNKKD